jgi:surface protein
MSDDLHPQGLLDAPPSDFDALQAVVRALQPLSADRQQRILEAVRTFLGIGSSHWSAVRESNVATTASTQRPSFSQDNSLTAKEFLLEKQPRSDVERVATLAYYLTNFRDQSHFKTLDISKLNTEAAQPKFSNAANSVNNAVKRGYLAPATKGNRQLSAAGEQFVLALPDRDAAKAAMTSIRPRRRSKRSRATPTPTEVS